MQGDGEHMIGYFQVDGKAVIGQHFYRIATGTDVGSFWTFFRAHKFLISIRM